MVSCTALLLVSLLVLAATMRPSHVTARLRGGAALSVGAQEEVAEASLAAVANVAPASSLLGDLQQELQQEAAPAHFTHLAAIMQVGKRPFWHQGQREQTEHLNLPPWVRLTIDMPARFYGYDVESLPEHKDWFRSVVSEYKLWFGYCNRSGTVAVAHSYAGLVTALAVQALEEASVNLAEASIDLATMMPDHMPCFISSPASGAKGQRDEKDIRGDAINVLAKLEFEMQHKEPLDYIMALNGFLLGYARDATEASYGQGVCTKFKLTTVCTDGGIMEAARLLAREDIQQYLRGDVVSD